MVTSATELPGTVSGTLSIVLTSQPEALSPKRNPERTLEDIESELLSLSLRQADVQARIQQVRHALVALVHVFGPEILATTGRKQKSKRQHLSRSGTKVIDISRRILSQSNEWLTSDQLLDAIAKESPAILEGFINPGVSVSNALRTLERHGEIEALSGVRPAKWRWVGQSQMLATRRSGD